MPDAKPPLSQVMQAGKQPSCLLDFWASLPRASPLRIWPSLARRRRAACARRMRLLYDRSAIYVLLTSSCGPLARRLSTS